MKSKKTQGFEKTPSFGANVPHVASQKRPWSNYTPEFHNALIKKYWWRKMATLIPWIGYIDVGMDKKTLGMIDKIFIIW